MQGQKSAFAEGGKSKKYPIQIEDVHKVAAVLNALRSYVAIGGHGGACSFIATVNIHAEKLKMADESGNGWRRKKLDEHYKLGIYCNIFLQIASLRGI